MIVVMPWQNNKLVLGCKYQVMFLSTASTVSCLKVVPLTLDCCVRVFHFTFYSQFHSASIYNHLIALLIVTEVSPFLAYEMTTMYPENPNERTTCDINNKISGYELYIVSIFVYLVSFVFVGYTMFHVCVKLRSAQDSEVKLMNKLSIGLSVITLLSILELNPIYDVTANLQLSEQDKLGGKLTWEHHEKAFAAGIAIKNTVEAFGCLILMSETASNISLKAFKFIFCCRFFRRKNQTGVTSNILNTANLAWNQLLFKIH